MKVLFAFLKFLLFLIVFAAGSFFPPFHIEHVLGTTPDGTRIFIWDGVVLMVILFVLLLLIGGGNVISGRSSPRAGGRSGEPGREER